MESLQYPPNFTKNQRQWNKLRLGLCINCQMRTFLRERGSVLLDNLTGKVTVKGKGKLALSLNFKGNTLSYYTLVRTAPGI